MANYTYQISLAKTEAGVVTVLSSTSSLFTLFLAAFFPSNGGDKFTLSKLVAVSVSILGLVCTILLCNEAYGTRNVINPLYEDSVCRYNNLIRLIYRC